MTIRSFAQVFAVAAILISSGLARAQELRMQAPRQHGPASIRHTREDGTATSTNWSGYAVAEPTAPAKATWPTGVSATYVAGTWVVPAVNCNVAGGSTAYAAFWVGIDGWYSSTVEQIGTDSDCSSGTPQYYAWYEFYPENSFFACPAAPTHGHSAPPPCPLQSLTVGDTMTATVTYNSNKTFTATITDVTQQEACIKANKSAATCDEYAFSTVYTPNRQTGTPQLSSAEWIAEAPCCGKKGSILPLADFTSVSFTNSVATVNNALNPGASGAQSLGSFGPITANGPITLWQSTMINENTPSSEVTDPPPADIMALPSLAPKNFYDFTVTWESVGP